MIVDWATMWQGFWLGAGFWTATVAMFVMLVVIMFVASGLMSVFDILAKKGGDDDRKRRP